MKPVEHMTDAELQTEWMACEQYINDPGEDDPERLQQAHDRQRDIEYQQDMIEHYRYFIEQQGYEE